MKSINDFFNPSCVRRNLFFRLVLFLTFLAAFLSCSRPPEKTSARYDFTYDWFTSNLPVWEKVLAAYRDKPEVHYLEVGIFEGRAVIWMLENVLTHPSSRVTAVDFFPEDLQEKFEANVRSSGFAEKITTINGLSQTVLRDLEPDSFDIIYIDAGHTADMTLMDAVLCWDLLKTEGLMIFDDYAWNRETYPAELRPGVAIDGFITAFRNYLEIVHRDYQVIVRKKPGPVLRDPYQTLLGDYVFAWQKDELQERSTGQAVDLAETEKETLKRIIRSRPDGETEFLINPKDLTNSNLLNRFQIDFSIHSPAGITIPFWIATAAALLAFIIGTIGTLMVLRKNRR